MKMEQKKIKGLSKKEYFKAYYEANKDKIKAYRESNKDRIAEYFKAYHEANKDNNKDKVKAYYEANKDKIAKISKVYYEANKDKIKAYRESNKDRIAEYFKAYHEANKDKIYKRFRDTHINLPLLGGREGRKTMYTNGITKEIKEKLPQIVNDVLEDCIKNPRKFLDDDITKKEE